MGRIAAGGAFSCALLDDGRVTCWGRGVGGELGYGNTNSIGDDEYPSANPVNLGYVELPGFAKATKIAAGTEAVCALLTTGRITCWGDGFYGSLGYGNTNSIGDNEKPKDNPIDGGLVSLPGGALAKDITVGADHSCAILVTGAVSCWGAADRGQLGYGNTNPIGDNEKPSANPVNGGLVALPGAAKAASIDAGDGRTCVLTTVGDVVCWGDGADGVLGYGNTNDIGDNETPAQNPVNGGRVPLPNGDTAVAVSVGGRHACAVSSDRASYACWGFNTNGQLGRGNETTIGDNETPASVPFVSGGTGALHAISAGSAHTCLVKATEVRCHGYGADGQLGNGSNVDIGDDEAGPAVVGHTDTGWIAVAAGTQHTCAIAEDGQVSCWGSGSNGRLGYGNTNAIGDDELVMDEPGDSGVLRLPGSTDVVSVSHGGPNTCALLASGGMQCWGTGANGRHGLGVPGDVGDNETLLDAPTLAGMAPLPATDDIVQVSVGTNHSCAVTAGGTVHCWGINVDGALGTGSGSSSPFETSHAAPPVGLPERALSVAVGLRHSCAVLASGRVACWGDGEFGQLGYGNTNDVIVPMKNPVNGGLVPMPLDAKVVSISAGDTHTCAVTTLRLAVCWGQGTAGRLGYGNVNNIGDNETPAQNPVNFGFVPIPGVNTSAVAAGADHTCSLNPAGHVTCWGDAAAGTLGYGDETDRGDNETPAAIPVNGGRVQLPGGLAALQISVGNDVSCALLSSHDVTCWGRGLYGRTGYGNDFDIGDNEKPNANPVNGGIVPMSGAPDVYAVDAGAEGVCVVRGVAGAASRVTCWGRGNAGRLGYGDENDVGDNELIGARELPTPSLLSTPDFVSQVPARLADTRAAGVTVDGIAQASGVVAAGTTLTIPIAGRAGVPITAKAVALSVVGANTAGNGYLTLFPCDQPQPNASSLNVTAGNNRANAAVTSLSAAGTLCVFSSVTMHVIVDLAGYFPATSGYQPMTPRRVVDTRATGVTANGQYQAGGAFAANNTRTYNVLSMGGGLTAEAPMLLLNVTAATPTGTGYFRVHACGWLPSAASLSYTSGLGSIAGMVAVPTDAAGNFCVTASAATHLIIDVLGQVPATGSNAIGSSLVGFNPVRLLDTRTAATLQSTIDGVGAGGGARPSGTTTVVRVEGRGPGLRGTTAAITVSALNATGVGYVTVWPCNRPQPNSSMLNYISGSTRTVTVLTQIAPNGTICVFNSLTTDLLVDYVGIAP